MKTKALFHATWMWLVVLGLIGLGACVARGQIIVPAEVEVGQPIVCTVNLQGVPEGAVLKGTVQPDIPGAEWLPGPVPNEFHVWAKPGKYDIEVMGMWGIRDPEKPTSWSDFGFFRYREKFVVVGDDPDPPPPPPPGKRRAVILTESAEQTPAQALLYDQLRIKLGAKLQVWDDDQPGAQQYLKLSKQSARPVLLVLTEAGQLVREVSVPSSVDAVEKEINR